MLGNLFRGFQLLHAVLLLISAVGFSSSGHAGDFGFPNTRTFLRRLAWLLECGVSPTSQVMHLSVSKAQWLGFFLR